MKTQERWLLLAAVALLGGHSLYSGIRLHRLEGRLERLQQESLSRSLAGKLSYSFDDSFIHYFGPQGVAEVERALKILRTPRVEPAPRSTAEDWNFPLEWRGDSRSDREEI